MTLQIWHSVAATLAVVVLLTSEALAQDVRPLTSEEQQAYDADLESLGNSLQRLRDRKADFVADAAIFHKGLTWALKYDREFSQVDRALMQNAISRGQERTERLAAGERPWSTRRGKLALGFVSLVDGSVQPYGLIVPKDYDPARPCRLDVVLHGSTRPVGLSELRFMARFDEGDGPSESPPDQPFIELHPLGRVENGYRWAGESDVFEAIDDVCQRYSIDKDRIVLRGMSMGASGTWHLGLKHPDCFVALGPYCGYVDTHHFSETPLPNFVKVGPLPEHQELGLHMLDSIDYAANAGVVPAIACMGEKDVFFQAHALMGEAMRREGLTMVNLISPGTGHVIDPATHAEQMRQIGEYAAHGIDRRPKELRFVTWTLKFNRCHWLEVLGLERHYARAEISGRLREARVEIDEPRNITRFALRTSQLASVPKSLRIGTQELVLPVSITAESPGVVIDRGSDGWQIAGRLGDVPLAGKRRGLQGPIDDAFASPFLCVRGTGQPWNPAVAAYADSALERFAHEWEHYFRGKLPIKSDTAVTAEDVQARNLILFGDPGSNAWIAKVLPSLPLRWTRAMLSFAGQEYSSERHLPVLITPNPLAGGERRYIVLNSGHTFRESELAKLNYLLFPRWGDWAILEIPSQPGEDPQAKESVLSAGFFDERWRISP